MNIKKIYIKYMIVYLIIFVFFAALKFIYFQTPLGPIVKFYFITSFMICFFYAAYDSIIIFTETKIFIIFSIIPIILGIVKYGFSSYFFSHILAVLLPIFAMSFGYKLGNYLSVSNNTIILERVLNLSYYSNIIIIILFQIAFALKIVSYPAIAPTGLIFSSLFYLSKNKYIKFTIGLIFVVISGKRASLFMMIFAALIFGIEYIRNDKTLVRAINRVLKWTTTSLIIIIPTIFYLWTQTRFLNRIKLVFKFDFSDTRAMYIATGGRSEEIINIIKFLNEQPLRYIFGSGFGVNVEVFKDFYRHYSHFSPLSYTLIFGVIFALLIYFLFFFKLLKKVNVNSNLYFAKLIFASFFASSFLGAIVMNDTNFWVFYGLYNYLISTSFIEKA